MEKKESISALERIKLRNFIKELEQYKGRHTELVSVYVPTGYDINSIINHLQEEQGTAQNIKSKTTRINVTDALERMIQHLKLFKKTPENGLAVFAGNVAEREGQSDVRVWSIEPPIPLKQRLYRCDKQFVLDIIADMAYAENVYGLVVLDMRDATIALLKGKSIVVLKKTHSEVPGKMRAGGQSAPRFARQRELALKEHYKKVADYMKEEFLNMPELKGIIIGGPSTTVTNFLNKEYITGDIEKKIIGTRDLSYTDEFGVRELVERAQDLLAKEEITEEVNLIKKFLTMLATKEEFTAYGEVEVKRCLEMGAVDILLISDSYDEKKIEELEKKAIEFSTQVKIISTSTPEGQQLKELGMLAAILRYPVR